MTRASRAEGTAHPAQPRGLYVLFGVEMWERFSYYGMRALLVLFLANAVSGFGYSQEDAIAVYKWYTTAVYVTPLLGGYLADRYMGTHRALLVGAVVISAGHFSLALATKPTFFVGLALIALGTGFFKSNISTMVGQLYDEGDRRRDAGFTIFYLGINLGAALGQFVCGWLSESPTFGYHYAFGAAGVGMLLGLAQYVRGKRKHLGPIGDVPARRATTAEATKAPAPPLTKLELERLLAVVILALFNVVFWAAFEQAGSSMNFFALSRTDRTLFGREIPAPWFQSVNPVVIVICGGLFSWLWTWLGRRGREPNTPAKMGLGLILQGMGFAFMVVGASASEGGQLASPAYLVLAYVFITWGELCVSPVGLSMVTKLAPARFASLLMGFWFLTTALANFLAGQLAESTTRIARGDLFRALGGQADFFLIFVVASTAAGVLLLLASRRLTRMMHERDVPPQGAHR